MTALSQDLRVSLIPVLHDNYVFVIQRGQQAAVVDPAVADPVIEVLEQRGLELVAILHTHHHSDHIGGTPGLLRRWPKARVIASAADRSRICVHGNCSRYRTACTERISNIGGTNGNTRYDTCRANCGDGWCTAGPRAAARFRKCSRRTNAHPWRAGYSGRRRNNGNCGRSYAAGRCGITYDGSSRRHSCKQTG